MPQSWKGRGAWVRTGQVILKTGNHAISNASSVVVNKTSGAATAITLPTNAENGRLIWIKDGKGDANSNNITITPASGTIDGAATYVIDSAYGGVLLEASAGNWFVAGVQAGTGGGSGTDLAFYRGDNAAPAANNETFFIANRKYVVTAVSVLWDVAAGGTSTIDIIQDTGTGAIASGTTILAAALSINTTARTVATPALNATPANLVIAKGNRLSFKYNHAIQSTSGLCAQVALDLA